jgi:hypothetical protein
MTEDNKISVLVQYINDHGYYEQQDSAYITSPKLTIFDDIVINITFKYNLDKIYRSDLIKFKNGIKTMKHVSTETLEQEKLGKDDYLLISGVCKWIKKKVYQIWVKSPSYEIYIGVYGNMKIKDIKRRLEKDLPGLEENNTILYIGKNESAIDEMTLEQYTPSYYIRKFIIINNTKKLK